MSKSINSRSLCYIGLILFASVDPSLNSRILQSNGYSPIAAQVKYGNGKPRLGLGHSSNAYKQKSEKT